MASPIKKELTRRQRDTLAQLRVEYGEPTKIVMSGKPLGITILRVDWCRQERHLFVMPSGARLMWMSINKEED